MSVIALEEDTFVGGRRAASLEMTYPGFVAMALISAALPMENGLVYVGEDEVVELPSIV